MGKDVCKDLHAKETKGKEDVKRKGRSEREKKKGKIHTSYYEKRN
jgi:hypothetical protein